MPQTVAIHRSLAEAVTKFVDSLHHIYSGIKIKPISNYEDEDFTFEIRIPKNLSIDQVLETCHKECIKVENGMQQMIVLDTCKLIFDSLNVN